MHLANQGRQRLAGGFVFAISHSPHYRRYFRNNEKAAPNRFSSSNIQSGE
jgi:hypothetical protein